jgi:predicted DNA-binding protein with PD1-like motif
MLSQSCECCRLVVVRLNSGDDVLESIRAAAEENGIKNGLVLSGVGSVNRYHIHVVATPGLPPRDELIRGEGPFDILSLSGLIIDGRVHAHITLSDTEKAIGGHLEEGSRILTFAVVALAEMPGIDLAGWDRVGEL